MDRIDTRWLRELTEQSQDLNSDGLRITREALGRFAEDRPGARRRANRSPLARPAASSDDVMALQTAASLENLAVVVYQAAAGLPFIKNGNKLVTAFIAKTTQQHTEHGKTFNSAVTQAGGKPQYGPDPKYAAMVKQASPGIKTPADLVKLAISLEDTAAQTYTKYVSQVGNAQLRMLFASVAPVEAQHRSVLLVVQALFAGNASQLVAIPTDPAKLPAAAGNVGFPDGFYPIKNASPINEGAVR